jgi:iron(III) transport system permease protein
LVLIVTIVPLILLSRRLVGTQSADRFSYHQAASKTLRSPASWAQVVGTTALSAYLLLGLVLPLSLVARWGLTIPAQGNLQGPFVTTLVIGVGAGLMTVIFGGFPAYLVSQNKTKSGLETLTFIASGVPGVMIGFGLLQVALRLPDTGLRVLAEGGGLLCLGLSLRFASHSYAALKPALLTQSQQSLDAAQLLGARTWRLWTRIRLPHLAPALASGFLLSFVAVVKELPISLLLLPAGETTLATRIFDANEDAHLGDLGAASLLLLAMVLVAQAILWRWSRHEH